MALDMHMHIRMIGCIHTRRHIMTMEDFFEQSGGVASTNQVSAFLGVSPGSVRAWATENGVPMVGNGFVFTLETTSEMAAELLDDDPDEDDDDTDDDDTDEDDTDDDDTDEDDDDTDEDDDDTDEDDDDTEDDDD